MFVLKSHLLLISCVHIGFLLLVDISAFISLCNQSQARVEAGNVWYNISYINSFAVKGKIWL